MAKNDTLQIGPVRLDDKIDPRDPNEAGSLGSASGAGQDALRIVETVNAQYAQNNLGAVLALPLNPARSEHDLIDYEEIAKVADLPEGAVVEGATVRGQKDDPDSLIVSYVVRYALEGEDEHPERVGAGRTARGVVRYNRLPKTAKRFDERKEQELKVARAARGAGGSESQFGQDPHVSVLQERLDKLEREREEYVARAEAAEAKLKAESGAADAENPNLTRNPTGDASRKK